MVRKVEEKPKGPHYGVVVFGKRTEWTPGYDRNDSGTISTYPEITYFAFTKKEDLEMWVGQASKANMKFMFFHVEKLGEVDIKVNVNTDV